MGFVAINNDYYRTPEYIKFAKTVRSLHLEFTIAHVVRESAQTKNPNYGGYYIYREHYRKGELVARFSQADMAKYFGTGQGHMSESFTRLEKEGFVKKIPVCTRETKILYYQVGTWSGKYGVEEGPDKYEEHLWFDEIFGAYAKVAKQKRGDDRRKSVMPSMRDMMDDIEYDEECEGPFGKDSATHYPKNG